MGNSLPKKARERITTAKKDGGTEINLSECGIRDWKSPISRMKLLVKLNLSSNFISVIPPQIERLKDLEWLSLSANEIATLPTQILKLSDLNYLDVSYNRLTQLPIDFGLKMKYLKHLNIAANQIAEVPEDFGQLKLLELDYSRNGLKSLQVQVFQITGLTTLRLGGNQIARSINADQLTQFPLLQILDISDTGLAQLPLGLPALTNLTELNVSNNRIRAIETNEINLLRKLRYINFSENSLTSLEPLDLGNMPDIEIVIANNNRLNSFSKHNFQHCTKLREIDLSTNEIQHLPRQLGWVSSIRKLWLGNNQIRVIPGDWHFMTPSMFIDLMPNPLKHPFNEWLDKEIPILLQNIKDYLGCYPPNCIATGEGARYGVAGKPTEFTLEGRTYLDEAIKHPDPLVPDVFEGYLIHVKDGKTNIETSSKQPVFVKNNDDGTYRCMYNCQGEAGTYQLHITGNQLPIKNSPFTTLIVPGDTAGYKCQVTVPKTAAVGKPFAVPIISYDRFGNKRSTGGDKIKIELKPSVEGDLISKIQDQNDGQYLGVVKIMKPGVFHLIITLIDGKQPVGESPYEIKVT